MSERVLASRSRLAPVLPVILAFLTVLGHHCVAPIDAEGVDHHQPAHHAEHDHGAAHGHGATGDGGDAHPSDCHVMATKAPAAAPAVTAVGHLGLPAVVSARTTREPSPAPSAPDRPPRYILHAALLI